jgi:hypothetical protein
MEDNFTASLLRQVQVMKVKLVDGMGPADFQPAPDVFVVYLGEGDVIGRELTDLKTRLERLNTAKLRRPRLKVFCLFQKTPMSLCHLPRIQSTVVLALTAAIVPVSGLDQVPQVLFQLFSADKIRNPFLQTVEVAREEERRRKDKSLLLAVCKVPGVGETKARALLGNLGSLKRLSRARVPELTPFLGPNLARGVETFFRRNHRV